MQNSQPLHVLRSYLNACEIPFEIENETLKVAKKDGASLKVVIGESASLDQTVCTIKDKEIISPIPEVFLAALHILTDAAGYGKPLPVDRGEAPTGRINYKDQFEEVYLRHSVLRRSPNPKDHNFLDKYDKTIRKTANRAFRRYRWILEPMGFMADDLVNIGRVHTVAFMHYYASSPNHVDNLKLLTEYLKQRFSELTRLCHKKGCNSSCFLTDLRNTVNHDEDTFSQVLNAVGDENSINESEEYVEGVYRLMSSNKESKLEIQRSGLMGLSIYVDNHLLTKTEIEQLRERIDKGVCKISPVEVKEDAPVIDNAPSALQRKAKARNLLIKNLNKMSPEERNIALAYAVYSREYEIDARIMAKKLCEELYCPTCKHKVINRTLCRKCGTVAVPRYGVDYVKVRKDLVPSVVCVKCGQNDCECEAGTKTVNIGGKEFTIKVKPPTTINYPDGESLTKSMVSLIPPTPVKAIKPEAPAVIEEKVVRASDNEISAAETEMKDKFWKNLPELIRCPRHNSGNGAMVSKSMFRPCIALRHKNGMPKRVRHTSYCVDCFKDYSQKKT
jgi:hypothetical protein